MFLKIVVQDGIAEEFRFDGKEISAINLGEVSSDWLDQYAKDRKYDGYEVSVKIID